MNAVRYEDASPYLKPLLFGAAAAAGCAVIIAALAFIGSGDAPIGARARLAPSEALALDNTAPARLPIEFGEAETASGDAPTLPGVDERTALTAPRPALRAPLPGLFEPGPGGPLPVVSAEGVRPDQAYAKAFDGDLDAPTIAVIVGGLGFNRALTETAIERLPSEVTLSFVPYAEGLQDWIDRARADGHEVLIELPMEPFDYPNNDPGPHTLLAEATPEENRRRLNWLLSRGAGYAGVVNYMGARLSAEQAPLAAVLEELERRGLTLFHDGSGRRSVITSAREDARARVSLADRVLDADPSPSAIDNRLLELEALALQNGDALGSGFVYPTTVEALAQWSDSLADRGYQLAPASFLAERRRRQAEGSG